MSDNSDTGARPEIEAAPPRLHRPSLVDARRSARHTSFWTGLAVASLRRAPNTDTIFPPTRTPSQLLSGLPPLPPPRLRLAAMEGPLLRPLRAAARDAH